MLLLVIYLFYLKLSLVSQFPDTFQRAQHIKHSETAGDYIHSLYMSMI